MVAKIKKKELHIFKEELIKKFDSEIKFYNPKIQYQKYFKNKIKNFKKNPNKLNYIYILTPKGVSATTQLTINFMKRKMKEYDELKKEIDR